MSRLHPPTGSVMNITDAMRWQHCAEHGFPSRNQHPNRPAKPGLPRLYAWTAYGPGSIRAQGDTPADAVDQAIIQTKGPTK